MENTDFDCTFQFVSVHDNENAFTLAVVDEIIDDAETKGMEPPDHSMIFLMAPDGWKHRMIEENMVSACPLLTDERKLNWMVISDVGKSHLLTLPGISITDIDTTDNGPNEYARLTVVKNIQGNIYAAGLARQVYQYKNGNWARIDKGIFVNREDRTESIGFFDLDGTEEKIYAVGYKGEIWCYDGAVWKQEKRLTDVVLTQVKVLPNGVIYAAGMAGTILCKDKNGWHKIEQTTTKEDFWGMAYFLDKLYLSNYEGVFVLEGSQLKAVKTQKVTTAYLDASRDVMWSVGEKHVQFTKDGRSWEVIQNP